MNKIKLKWWMIVLIPLLLLFPVLFCLCLVLLLPFIFCIILPLVILEDYIDYPPWIENLIKTFV